VSEGHASSGVGGSQIIVELDDFAPCAALVVFDQGASYVFCGNPHGAKV
jgi:hypothetical protein